jgi:Sortase domain
MDISPRRRRAISTLLAVFLAVESVSAVAAAAGTSIAARAPEVPAAHALPAASPEGLVFAATGAEQAQAPAPTASPIEAQGRTPGTTATPTATPVPRPTPRATPRPAASTSRAVAKPAAAAVYAGRNHVWMPSLGINQAVQAFPCSRTRPPDNYVYLWGCSGTNNTYLLGHAASVFQPLHDAYVAGRLKAGMRVWYANGAGTVHQYAVQWWRLTLPTTDASWAWAPQAVPSMTLQTCMGANSQYRLMVRLVQVGG